MAFEVFQRPAPPHRGPAVTVTQRGTLKLSPAAHVLLGETRNVALMYDRETRTIGLQATQDTDDYLVTKNRTVTCPAFVKAFDIPHQVAVRRTAEMREGILCVDVNADGVPVTSNRAGTGKRSRDDD